MPKTDRFRALYVLKYLWEHTDEEHPVTLAQIQNHLSEQGIEAIPKTIDGDITALQDLGFDIIRNRSTQNQYFFASRYFSSFELKLMIDAVQAAKFIPREQTKELVERIARLANKNQSEDLRRNLFVTTFLMYGDETTDVTLSCTYDVMEKVIDRFGEEIAIQPSEDEDYFLITEPVTACSTFYSWVFNYGGKTKIVAPEKVKQDFDDQIHKFL